MILDVIACAFASVVFVLIGIYIAANNPELAQRFKSKSARALEAAQEQAKRLKERL